MSVRLSIVVIAACIALAGAAPVFAHTGLVESRPADGAAVDRPVRVVKLTFGAPVELVGDRAELLDASGGPVDATVKVAGPVVTVRPDAPLETGDYGVRWTVRSDDGHPVRESITFAVTADIAADATGDTDAAATAAPVHRADDAPAADAAAHDPTAANTAADATLAAALARNPTRWLRVTDQALRAVFTALALSVVGTIAFLVVAWRGSRRELRMLARLVARLSTGMLLVVVAQVAVRAARTAGGWSGTMAALPDTLVGPYGAGNGMRVVGAALVLAGVPRLHRMLRRESTIPIAGGAVDVIAPHPSIDVDGRSSARRSRRGAVMAMSGALLLVASFALVGHAATADLRGVASAAIIAHVLAGALWAGGLVALGATLWHRHRAGVPLQAGSVAVKFSVLATVGVLLAAAAGIALAVMRLESVVALWTTGYGIALSAKALVVAVTAGMGAYNHLVVVPVLERTPGHTIGHRLRRLGMIEVLLLAVVVALTSVLVGLGS